jgi:hypothetical protein
LFALALIGTLWFTSNSTAELELKLTVIELPPGVELPPHPSRASIAAREIATTRAFFMEPPKLASLRFARHGSDAFGHTTAVKQRRLQRGSRIGTANVAVRVAVAIRIRTLDFIISA